MESLLATGHSAADVFVSLQTIDLLYKTYRGKLALPEYQQAIGSADKMTGDILKVLVNYGKLGTNDLQQLQTLLKHSVAHIESFSLAGQQLNQVKAKLQQQFPNALISEDGLAET
ncbi:MAG: hypothetical protein H6765_03350 [Candidatus Peribacteria bacterium]|nr:MAG: hypothetical protein H6765_03350 [Candidatus Peribacteria bacterium]